MKRTISIALCSLCVVCIAAVPGRAGSISLVEASLDDLLGSSYAAIGSLMTTDMSDGNLVSEVYSQAYLGDDGLYGYLYQVNNMGTAGNSAAELFTLGLFAGSVS